MKKFYLLVPIGILAAMVAWKLWPQTSQAPTHSPTTTKSQSIRENRVANSQIALNERLKAAKEISTDLSNEELKQLLAFLAKPIDPRTGEQDFMAINEVMNQLRRSGMACGEYATALSGLIRDPKTHPVVRDYAVQHAASWIEDSGRENFPSQITAEDRGRLLDCIIAFLHEPTSTTETGFGTTLNVMMNLKTGDPREQTEFYEQMEPKILNILEGREPATLTNRLTALQSLPMLPQRERAIGIARNLLTEAEGNSPFKMAAIGVLGRMGDSSDLATLREIQKTDPRFQYAATAAVQKLEASRKSPR